MFTAFRHTLDAMVAEVAAAGIPAAAYHGSLSRREKDAAVAAFAGDVPVLLSTESAGEGRNLQFCHVMINMDLPWNPMQIEQRLGRLHRVGQQHDVAADQPGRPAAPSSSASCTCSNRRSTCSSWWSASWT